MAASRRYERRSARSALHIDQHHRADHHHRGPEQPRDPGFEGDHDMTVLEKYSLQHKMALVTGAGSGIGRAIALAFAQAGAAVGCADIDAGAARRTSDAISASGGKALPVTCDVSQEADAAAAASAVADAFGAIHVLVNAAVATDPTGTVLDYSRADWDRVFAINVTGVFLMSRA